MRFVLLLAALFVTAAPAAEGPKTLDELLEAVRAQTQSSRQENAAREQKFTEARERQADLLAEAKAQLAAEQAREASLRAAYETNSGQLAQNRQTLRDSTRELGEMQSTAKQIASALEGMLQASMVSAQIPGRAAEAGAIAQRAEMPSIEDLTRLWQLYLEEAVESGKVVRFPTKVVTGNGSEEERTVTRVGTFVATSGGRFLNYRPESAQLVEPARQPPTRLQKLAAQLESATSGVSMMPIDPTRGALLALLVESPDLLARIRQAGVIGYVILALGALAFLVAVERFIVLFGTRRRIAAQRAAETPRPDNPLGRLRLVEQASPHADAETLGLKLDQALMKEIPRLRRRLPALAVLATAAPLMGLLGTVAGMIETFQSMTLFGAGDPKIVAGGISLALVATFLGLVVAIPVLLLHGWLHSMSNQVVHTLEEEIATLVARREEQSHALVA